MFKNLKSDFSSKAPWQCRVIDTTGFCNTEGLISRGNRDPNKLFYDSKEQYIEQCCRATPYSISY